MSQFQTPAPWNVTSVSPIVRANSNDSFAFVTTHDSTVVRNSITGLFVALNFLLGFAGAAYIRTRARSRVARKKSVSVKHLTSWLSLPDVASYTWSLRSLPGGWLGVLMIFTGLINILHQFATNTLVTPALVPTRCVFDYGSVWNPNVWSTLPNTDDEGANLVYQAQLATLKNHGVRGIYHKFLADNEIQMFRPEAQDTHGAWNCANVKNDTLPWTGAAVDGEALASRSEPAGVQEQLVYNYFNSTASGLWNWEGSSLSSDEYGELWFGFLLWYAPNQTLFNVVHAAALIATPIVDKKATVLNFDCTYTSDSATPEPNVADIIGNWMGKAYGYQKLLPTMQESALWLELTLDQITNLVFFNDWVVPQNINKTESIGCVVEGTRVSAGIVTILGTVFFLMVALLTAQSVILLRDFRHYKKKPGNLLPFDLADWQLATYRQCKGERDPTFNDLRNSVCRHDAAEDGLWMEMRLADSSNRTQTADSRFSALPNKFVWRDSGNVEYGAPRAESFSNKPWVDLQERAFFQSDRRQSSLKSPYSSISGSYDSQYADNRWLLER